MEKHMSEKESLHLITSMINQAKRAYHDTGVSSIMWGSVVAIASLVKLSEIHFNYRLPFNIYLLTFVAIIPQIFITMREKKRKKVKSYDDVYMNYIWLGFGITIFLLIHITNNVFREWAPVANEFQQLTGNPASFHFYEFITPLFLILYGFPTFITGAACKFKPMLWGGLFCWVCCIITVYTTIKVDLFLTALSAIVAWFIPGIMMERAYQKAKKAVLETHV